MEEEEGARRRFLQFVVMIKLNLAIWNRISMMCCTISLM